MKVHIHISDISMKHHITGINGLKRIAGSACFHLKRFQWKITCLESQWMLSLVGTSHFAGIIAGSAMFGVLADRFSTP